MIFAEAAQSQLLAANVHLEGAINANYQRAVLPNSRSPPRGRWSGTAADPRAEDTNIRGWRKDRKWYPQSVLDGAVTGGSLELSPAWYGLAQVRPPIRSWMCLTDTQRGTCRLRKP